MMKTKKIIYLAVCAAAALSVLFMPAEWLRVEGLSVVEQRVIAAFAFAALMWVTEAIPVWTTSVLVIVLLLLGVSDSSFAFLRGENVEGARQFGKLINYKSLMATFADPIIMLFLGGFFLAIAAGKCSLDRNLARIMFKPFGTKSSTVLLGLMAITALFSMFMSNTATTAMMFAVMAPLLKPSPNGGKGRIALVLAIPVAANVGGIGTPIGTPPNAIALKYLNESGVFGPPIGFGQWMAAMVPLAAVTILFAWVALLKLFPFKRDRLEVSLEGSFERSPKAYIVYATFAATVLLWMFDRFTGLNPNVVAMIPMAVFSATGIVGKEDLKMISWDVLWLVAGGFALGVAFNDTGLAERLVNSVPFASWPPVATIFGAGAICYVFATFMSHTATTSLLVPVLAAVAAGMGGAFEPFGGVTALLVGVALSASLAMALPISTPPNAIAHSEGIATQRQMAAVGLLVGAFGLALGYAELFLLGSVGYF